MRVTFITPGLVWKPSGSFLVLFQHANRLVAAGHAVTIVFPDRPPQRVAARGARARLRSALTDLRRAHKRTVPWFDLDPRVALQFVRKLDSGALPSGDAVVAATWHVADFVAGLPARFGDRFYLVHHYEGHKYGADVIDRTLALPMAKIGVSGATCRELIDRGFGPVHLVPNGIDLATYRVTAPVEGRGPVVAMNFVAKELKDPWTGVAAIEHARGEHPDLRAVLFGTASRPADLPQWIEYRRGLATEDLVETVYNASAAFVLSSRLEGFGFPAAEAMACGCAVVTTACKGVDDFAMHEQTALVVPPGDAASLGRELSRVLADGALRARLVKGGLTTVSDFTWERSTAKLIAVLEGSDCELVR